MKKKGIIFFLFTIVFALAYSQDLGTTDAMLLLNEASSFYNRGKYQLALDRVNKSIEINDEITEAFLLRGYIFYALENYESACSDLARALEMGAKESNIFRMLESAYLKLGDIEKSRYYGERAENPVFNDKFLPLEDINHPLIDKFVREFNWYQKEIGNPPARLDPRLVNAAKAHGEYILNNHRNEPLRMEWHYEESTGIGFIGVQPKEQAAAFGFFPASGYYVGNTMTDFIPMENFDPKEFISHIVTTIYHRNMVISPGFEAIGFYPVIHEEKLLPVFFFSSWMLPSEPQVIRYPAPGQTEISLEMLPELPDPFPGDPSVGFPITVQFFSNSLEPGPIIASAVLSDESGRIVPVYILDSNTEGMSGDLMETLKMVAVAAKDPLKPGARYKITLKLKDAGGNIIFFDTWDFSTREE